MLRERMTRLESFSIAALAAITDTPQRRSDRQAGRCGRFQKKTKTVVVDEGEAAREQRSK